MPRLLHTLDNFPWELRGGVVSVGNFDGVHVGHAKLIEAARTIASSRSLGSSSVPIVVFTFDPHPITLLRPDLPVLPRLTSIARRTELLGTLGVDAVVAYPTDVELLKLSAKSFFDQVIVASLGARAMVEGENFRFGHNREGDTSMLKQFCDTHAMTLAIVDAQKAGDNMISSTNIRELLTQGAVTQANQCLTAPYQITGKVSRGAGRGRTLGTPTANLSHVESQIPGAGVYAGFVQMNGQRIAAAINIGPNPTFEDQSAKVEVHLIGWEGKLYDQNLDCAFLQKIRNVKKFDSVDQLQLQIAADIKLCQHICSPHL